MALARVTRGCARFVAQPLVQFLLLGAVFYAAYAWMHESPSEASDKVILVTAADVSRLDAAWRARWGRAPTSEELAGVVKSHVRERALYQHAVALGLDRNDVAMRRLLGQKLEGMIQNLVELSLSPTEAELRSEYDGHPERYRSPDRITFTQLFLDPDKREDDTLRDAKEILTKLRQLKKPTEGIEKFGDAFMLQRYYPGKTRLEVEKLFGEGFTNALFELTPEVWHGPVLSGYGVHLVYVRGLETGRSLPFDSIRDRVQQDWMDRRRKEVQADYLRDVLSNYEVVVEEAAPERLAGSSDAGGAKGD